MYQIYHNGDMLYDSTDTVSENQIANAALELEANKPGTFSFAILPTHTMIDSIDTLSSMIRVVMDGVEVFTGRVSAIDTDFYKQKNVTCEGELAFFYDTIQRPWQYGTDENNPGNAVGMLTLILEKHNESASQDKQFVLGNVTAISTQDVARVENASHQQTFTLLEDKLIEAYGGYFVVRHEDGVRYLDYLKEGVQTSQDIAFGVNLLDLKKSIGVDDLFSVLIPLGKAKQSGGETSNLTIKDVNGGLDYIENTEAVARFGKIWHTKTWDYIDDAAVLKAKAEEYLQTGAFENATFELSAIDLHLTDAAIPSIPICASCRLVSDQHGYNITKTVTRIKMKLDEPEKTQYTFGKPIQTLTDNTIWNNKQTGGGGGGGGTKKPISEEVQRFIRDAVIYQSAEDGVIYAYAQQIDTETGEKRLSRIDLNGVEAQLQLKVSKDNLISEINLQPGTVRISADHVDLDGYVTAESLQSGDTYISMLHADEIYSDGAVECDRVITDDVTCTGLVFYGTSLTLKTMTFYDAYNNPVTIKYLGYA